MIKKISAFFFVTLLSCDAFGSAPVTDPYDISDLNQARVLASLVSNKTPFGSGMHDSKALSTMTDADAATYIAAKGTKFDYVWGRYLKVDFKGGRVVDSSGCVPPRYDSQPRPGEDFTVAHIIQGIREISQLLSDETLGAEAGQYQ